MIIEKNREQFMILPTLALVREAFDEGKTIYFVIAWMHYAIIFRWFDIMNPKEGEE